MFNETCIMLISYHCLFFTGIFDDGNFNYTLGYSCVFIAGINIAVNVINILIEFIRKIVAWFRKQWSIRMRKRKEKQRIKKYAEKLYDVSNLSRS